MRPFSFSFSFGTCFTLINLYIATYVIVSKYSIWCWRNYLCLQISFCTGSFAVILNSIAFTVAPYLLGISTFTDLAIPSFYPRESQLLWRRLGLVKLEVCSIKASFWWVVFFGAATHVVKPRPSQNATLTPFTVLKTSPRLLAPLWPWKT